jgi:hypothetical protein
MSTNKKETCSVCGHVRAVNKRTDEGNALCSSCYQKQRKAKCSMCGKISTIQTRKNGEPVCPSCYQDAFRPRERCYICDKIKIVAVRTTDNQPICLWCSRQQQHSDCCSMCWEWRPINKIVDNQPVCGRCYMRTYQAPERICGKCGRMAKTCKWNNDHPLCSACYCALPEVVTRRFNARTKYRGCRDLAGEVSTSEWLSLMQSTDWTCFYCGTSISKVGNRSVDHIIPISCGGRHSLVNLVPSCRICNASKNDRSFAEWIWGRPDVLRLMGWDRLGRILSAIDGGVR